MFPKCESAKAKWLSAEKYVSADEVYPVKIWGEGAVHKKDVEGCIKIVNRFKFEVNF